MLIKKESVAVLPPDNLLLSPCDVSSAGETVRSLAAGYLENVSCVEKHKVTLESLRNWKKEQQKIYSQQQEK